MNGLRSCASGLAFTMALSLPAVLHATDYRVPAGAADGTPKTLTGNDTLTVDPNALLTSPTDPTISQVGAAGNVIVQNSGRIEGPAGSVFSTTGNGTPRTITINNASSGVIVAAGDAIRVNSDIGRGTVTVNNIGSITSNIAQAIDFDAVPATGGTLTISNFAGGVIRSGADDAIRSGFATVNNAGTIVSDGVAGSTSDAIDTQSGVSTISNVDGGVISGYRNGIAANGAVNVVNAATAMIGGRNGAGISAGGLVTINNLGRVIGATDGVASGAFSVQNRAGATIQGTAGIGLIAVGGGTLGNAGTIAGAVDGIRAGGAVTIDNVAAGLLVGNSGAGVQAGGALSLNNAGRVSGGSIGAGSGGNATIINIAGGSIVGGTAGVSGSANVAIGNDGSIGGGAVGVSAAGSLNLTNGVGANIAASNGSGVIASSDATISNSGTISGATATDGDGVRIGGTATITNLGTIRGSGAGIRLTGATNDTVNNSGTIIGTNGPAISLGAGDDRLNLITTSVIQGAIDGGAGTDAIFVGGTTGTTGTLGPTTNFEALNIQGATWIVTGNSTYANGINITNGGRLDNRGTLLGQTTVNGGEVVNGGTFQSLTVTSNSSAIRPGGSGAIGTITVNGNYLQNNGSIYFVDVTAAGAADRIAVGGTATLQGAPVIALTRAAGTYAIGTRYTVLSATGGLTGTFGGVAADPDPLTFLRVSYGANAVFVDVLRNGLGLNLGATTPNQAAVADALGKINVNAPIFGAVAGIASTTQLTAVLDAISGESYASTRAGLAQDARRVTAAIATRFETATPRSGAWLQGIVASGRADGTKGAANMKQQAYGAVGGVDVWTVDRMRGGVAIGYTHDKTDVGARGSSTSSNAFQAALYGGGSFGRVNFRVVAGYSWIKLDSRRNVALPTPETVRASYNGSAQFGMGEISYAIPFAKFTVSPFAAAQLSHVNTDSANETGGISALTVAAGGEDISAATAGVRVVGPAEGPILIRGSLGFRRIIGTNRPRVLASFVNTGTAFSVFGASLPRYAGVGDIDLVYRLGDRAQIGVGYSGVVGSGGRDHAARVTFAVGL